METQISCKYRNRFLFKSFIAQTAVSKGLEGKIELVHSGIRSTLDCRYRCSSGAFNMTTSRNSCWRSVPLVLSYCCNVPGGNHISGVQHATRIDRPCI